MINKYKRGNAKEPVNFIFIFDLKETFIIIITMIIFNWIKLITIKQKLRLFINYHVIVKNGVKSGRHQAHEVDLIFS